MLIETLQALFSRDLKRLKDEIELYSKEENLWIIDKGIANSAGNLCLHLLGNLNTYIAAQIGGTDYVRNRALEFSAKSISRNELTGKIDKVIALITQSLSTLTEQELQQEYPILVFDKKTSTEFFLVHLVTHLNYHLGQINYHRRLLDN
jgi:uncharacterized damage-inducible protein DinB